VDTAPLNSALTLPQVVARVEVADSHAWTSWPREHILGPIAGQRYRQARQAIQKRLTPLYTMLAFAQDE
jgi:hypothetical protein